MTEAAQPIVPIRPLNISEDDPRFKPAPYYPPHLRIRELDNVFCTDEGLCLKYFRLIKEGFYEYPKPLAEMYKQALRAYVSCRILGRRKFQVLENDCEYLIIHQPWFNYYHWLLDCIPRLLLVIDRLSELTLLLPERYKESSYALDTLKPFDFKDTEYIPSLNCLKVKKLILPQIRPQGRFHDPTVIMALKERYEQYLAQQTDVKLDLGSRLYVTRKAIGKRNIKNEAEVKELLSSHGFVEVDFSNHSFFEQVALMQHVQCLIATHGAGLSNVIFLPPGASVLEFHKEITHPEDYISDLYWYLAPILKLKWYAQICQPIDKKQHFTCADITVDISKLEQNLALMLS